MTAAAPRLPPWSGLRTWIGQMDEYAHEIPYIPIGTDLEELRRTDVLRWWQEARPHFVGQLTRALAQYEKRAELLRQGEEE